MFFACEDFVWHDPPAPFFTKFHGTLQIAPTVPACWIFEGMDACAQSFAIHRESAWSADAGNEGRKLCRNADLSWEARGPSVPRVFLV
ncbi:hypothetical protein CA85_49800 [Allorhodopirellula solitaria]|uniref:Uncharacterized protein n=1 Tax=Allorhodopirellula solitaria TaxID=2527987 RepID=A0A5C5WZN9_9BACT|nr:hypothetical protein CA85_49800 [Allorhodopirellula solitaria]